MSVRLELKVISQFGETYEHITCYPMPGSEEEWLRRYALDLAERASNFITYSRKEKDTV